LYRYETYCLTSKEEHKLQLFEKVIRKVSGPKTDDVRNKILNNKNLHGLYWSHNIVKKVKSSKLQWTGHVALAHRILVGDLSEYQNGNMTDLRNKL
jgi:hypothetical protein